MNQGIVITDEQATRLRESPCGGSLGTHFATPASRRVCINGYTLKTAGTFDAASGGVPRTLQELHGMGGGSFCNHSATPNACLVRDQSATESDGRGLFVVATHNIAVGDFIHVDYGRSYLASNKTNILSSKSLIS